VVVRGIDPVLERGVADYAALLPPALRQGWEPGGFGVVLGVEIAQQMGVRVGDRVTLVAPGGQVTPAGVLPRLKQLEVLGLIDTGHYEFDATLAVMQLDDARRLLRLEGPNGLRLRLRDAQQARAVASELSLQIDPLLVVRDWTRQNRNWFAAVQIEKRMMFIILTLIVAVAAFNLVSTLVMTVTDKQSDIAILRTLGASPGSIMAVFMVQGALVGVVGTLSGLLLGLAVAFNIDVIVPAIEHALGLRFLPQDIYLISRMPSDPQLADIGPVVVLSLLLALFATLYPSWRASRVQPAEALRYE
jgi:lipoprotein-releasing system permease protein